MNQMNLKDLKELKDLMDDNLLQLCAHMYMQPLIDWHLLIDDCLPVGCEAAELIGPPAAEKQKLDYDALHAALSANQHADNNRI